MAAQIQVDSLMIAKDIVIAVAAFSGMGLGFYNLWNEHRKEQVRLRVVPKSVLQTGKNALDKEMVLMSENEFKGDRYNVLFAIEVVNLSKFPIVVDEVGFLKKNRLRMSVPKPIIRDQGSWPRKLEPREAVTVYVSLSEMMSSKSMQDVHSAFAKTSCGHTGKGSTEALKQLVSLASQKATSASTGRADDA